MDVGWRLSRRVGFLLFCVSTLVQCGGPKTISSNVHFEVIPKSPVVILSDFTLRPGATDEKKISGPWFLLNYSVANDSDETITVQSLLFKITSLGNNGQVKTSTVTIDPADYKLTDTYYLEEIAPHTSVTPAYGIYVSGLEKDVATYSYSVEVEVQGWIGTSTEPKDRLIKFSYFSTK